MSQEEIENQQFLAGLGIVMIWLAVVLLIWFPDSMWVGLLFIFGFIGLVRHAGKLIEDSEQKRVGRGRHFRQRDFPVDKEPYLTQQVATDVAESVDLNLDAVAALMAMKIKKIDAVKAVREAQETLGAEATTAQIVTEALRPK